MLYYRDKILFIVFLLNFLNYALADSDKYKDNVKWTDASCCIGSMVGGYIYNTDNVLTLVGTKHGNTLSQSIHLPISTQGGYVRYYLKYETCIAWITQYNGECNYKYSLENCVNGVTLKCKNYKY